MVRGATINLTKRCKMKEILFKVKNGSLGVEVGFLNLEAVELFSPNLKEKFKKAISGVSEKEVEITKKEIGEIYNFIENPEGYDDTEDADITFAREVKNINKNYTQVVDVVFKVKE